MGSCDWAFGVRLGNAIESASYKPEKWAAGDMFFVYLGKNGQPLESLRLKNLIYGLQDYLLLQEMEKNMGSDALQEKLSSLLGAKDCMKFISQREVHLEHRLDYHSYMKFRETFFNNASPKDSPIQKISDAVVDMDEDQIIPLIDQALEQGVSFDEIYHQGLSSGMLRVTRLFEEKKYFVSEVIVCADTLNKGINYLKTKTSITSNDGPKVILGVVEGDLHEIGKNIVKIMFDAAGFQVIDMGLNVTASDIVNKAIQEETDIIGLSTMMTTTIIKMQDVIQILKDMKGQRIPKIIIGGGYISDAYSKEIGADGYSSNAIEAVKLVQQLTKGES